MTQTQPKVKAPSKQDQILTGISELNQNVSSLVKILSENITKTPETPTPSTSPTPTITPYKSESYVPSEFRRIVDEVLSPEFGLEVQDFVDRTEFQVTIIVPERFNTLTPDQKKLTKRDERVKIIPRALGANGVRDYANLVRQNLNKFFATNGIPAPFANPN